MHAIWSDEEKLARWLEVELAALDAWAELGVVPDEAARTIREQARPPSPERVAELEATPPPRHGRVRRRGRGDARRAEGRWFHYGLTSSDVVDTALALQVREAGALLRRRPRPGAGRA